MASTNPFQHASDDNDDDTGEGTKLGRRKRSRGADSSERTVRKHSRGNLRNARVGHSENNMIAGWPKYQGLKPVLMFLSVPAMVVLLITIVGGGLPKPFLYLIALGLGAVVAVSAFRTVELIAACMIIYLPFSKVFVIPLAPGVNGTNMLILAGLFAAVMRALDKREKISDWPPGTTIVLAFAVFTALSAVTISLTPGGSTYLLYGNVLTYKSWIDQFIFYFIVLACVRDTEVAKRCFVYMVIGSMLVVLYAIPEVLEKMGRSTIEKSRIEGPHQQSNNFGGFVAYTLLSVVALFIVYIKDFRAWLVTPYFLLAAKVLITTFSRGAYLAMLAGGLLAGVLKGKGFMAFWGMLVLCFLLVFPSVIPQSILARMGMGTEERVTSSAAPDGQLDKSSATRIIMWRAAAQMIVEDPIFGKGFAGFPREKAKYIDVVVKESDPHNMYLYIGSQMGLPALALFLLILGYSFTLGRYLSGHKTDKFIRAIGIAGASSTACYAVVCIFGSRAIALNFTAHFWTLLVVMQVIKQQQLRLEESLNPKAPRTNAFALALASNGPANASDSVDDEPLQGRGTNANFSSVTRKRAASTQKSATRGAAAHLERERTVSRAERDDKVSPTEMEKTDKRSSRRARRAGRSPFKKPSQ